jgi:hypothetical protein
MQLHYLDFDFSDEESGRGSFDAMASVLADRLPALLAEIAVVLGWARATFGPPGAMQDESTWHLDLQGITEPDILLEVEFDEGAYAVILRPAVAGPARTTLTLTLSGSPAFCEALRENFIEPS